MAATKTIEQLVDWEVVDAGDNSQETADIDVSTVFRSGIFVVACPVEAVANALGLLVIVQGKYGTNNEDWRTLYTLRMGAGTANTANVAVEAGNGQADIIVDDGTNFAGSGEVFLIHNTVAAVNSELARIVATVFNGNDTITVIDNLANTQQTSANLFDIVAEKLFPLPDEISTARVLAFNDDADCDVLWRVDIARLTAIS